MKKKAVAAKKISSKKEAGPREGKYFLLRKILKSGKQFTADQLTKASLFDDRNLRVALSMLRNPKRTPKERMIQTHYDPEKKLFIVD